MEYTKILVKLASRKFLLSLVCVVAASILCYLRIVDQVAFSSIVITVNGAYLASNVIQDSQYAGK